MGGQNPTNAKKNLSIATDEVKQSLGLNAHAIQLFAQATNSSAL